MKENQERNRKLQPFDPDIHVYSNLDAAVKHLKEYTFDIPDSLNNEELIGEEFKDDMYLSYISDYDMLV